MVRLDGKLSETLHTLHKVVENKKQNLTEPISVSPNMFYELIFYPQYNYCDYEVGRHYSKDVFINWNNYTCNLGNEGNTIADVLFIFEDLFGIDSPIYESKTQENAISMLLEADISEIKKPFRNLDEKNVYELYDMLGNCTVEELKESVEPVTFYWHGFFCNIKPTVNTYMYILDILEKQTEEDYV